MEPVLIYSDDPKTGKRLFPHKRLRGEHKGKYQMHPRYVPERNKSSVYADFVEDISEVVKRLKTGEWCLRMSPAGERAPASLIEPDRIVIDKGRKSKKKR